MTSEIKNKRHRHEATSWLIANGYYEWCYQCGAIRRMEKMEKINGVYPVSNWCKPQKENPYEKWQNSFKKYEQRKNKSQPPLPDHQS